MLAAVRRLSVQDFFLVAFSVMVIVLTHWPDSPRRQWVQLRLRNGELRRYSIPQGDVALQRLKLVRERWMNHGLDTRVAIANWRLELSEHYGASWTAVAETENISGKGAQVLRRAELEAVGDDITGASGQVDLVGFQTASSVGTAEHAARSRKQWLRFGEQSRAEIRLLEQQRESRSRDLTRAPVVFGPTELGGKPSLAFKGAISAGLFAGVLYSISVFCFPALAFLRSSDMKNSVSRVDWSLSWTGNSIAAGSGSCPLSDGGGHQVTSEMGNRPQSELSLDLPEEWIHIRQPWGVALRRLCVLMLTVFAGISIVW